MSHKVMLKFGLKVSGLYSSILDKFLADNVYNTVFFRYYKLSSNPQFDYLHTEYIHYEKNSFSSKLNKALKTGNFFCEINGDSAFAWIVAWNKKLIFSCLLPREEYLKSYALIQDTIEQLSQAGILYTYYINPYNDTHDNQYLASYRHQQHMLYNNCHTTAEEIEETFLQDEIWYIDKS